MTKTLILSSILTLVTSTSFSVALAGPMRCESIFSKSRTIEAVASQESAVEVEIGASDLVMDLFDTLDGTIAPVIKGIKVERLPQHLYKTFFEYSGNAMKIPTVPWDVLSISEKKELIMFAAKERHQDFFESRKVEGLKYRDNISLNFSETTTFLGQTFKPGRYQFNSSDVFTKTAIEFMGPEKMTENLGFELHVRGTRNAGTNFLSARALQMSLVNTHQNVHEHVVAPYPETKENIEIEAFRRTEFTRRATLIFDVLMAERKIPMASLSKGSVDYFFPNENATYSKLYASFISYANSGASSSVFSKGGTVGVRSYQFYDKPVWGLEFRYLPPSIDKVQTASRLSYLQDLMLQGDFFMSPKETEDFLKFRSLDAKETVLRRLNYADSYQFGSNLYKWIFNARDRQLISSLARENDFVKMIFHDWSLDPMFYNNPQRLEQIEMTRAIAIKMLLRGTPTTEVVAYFIKKSGIAYELNQQMNLP